MPNHATQFLISKTTGLILRHYDIKIHVNTTGCGDKLQLSPGGVDASRKLYTVCVKLHLRDGRTHGRTVCPSVPPSVRLLDGE